MQDPKSTDTYLVSVQALYISTVVQGLVTCDAMVTNIQNFMKLNTHNIIAEIS